MRPIAASIIALGTMGLILLAACDSSREAPAPASQVNDMSAEFRALEISALAGSSEDAFRLLHRFATCHKRPDATKELLKSCLQRLQFWTQVAVENGNAAAAQRHTAVLLRSVDCRDIYRAQFWYGKFADYYSDDPVFLKSVRQQIDERKRDCRW
jgi:hypothetical protein